MSARNRPSAANAPPCLARKPAPARKRGSRRARLYWRRARRRPTFAQTGGDRCGSSAFSPVARLAYSCRDPRLALPDQTSRSAGLRTKDEEHMEIRDAVPADAPAACEVLRRSIIELCAADHHNEPVILERWLANKTPEIVDSWIRQPGNSVLVAVEGDAVLAVGSVTVQGEITLK